MNRTVKLSCLSFVLFFQLAVSVSAELDVSEVVKACDLLMRGNSNQIEMSMQVHTSGWDRTYEMRTWSSGIDKSFSRVLAPARVKGQAHLKLGTRLWNYIPAAERTILIPPSLMLDSYMGSDFSNDDMVKMSYIARDYTHTLLGEEIIDETPAYKIELLPKPDAPVVYHKLILWVRQTDSAPMKVEFYSEDETVLKTLYYSEFRNFGERNYPAVWKMVNHQKDGNETTVTIKRAEFDIPIEDSVFSKRNLEQKTTD